MDFTVIDIETTGPDPSKDKTCELGAARFSGNQLKARGSTLVNPYAVKGIGVGATQVHDIGDYDVLRQPTIRQAWSYLKLKTKALVFYNGLWFDIPVLRRELGPDDPFAGYALFDPFVWVKWYFPAVRGKSLVDMCVLAGVLDRSSGGDGDAHSASADCVMTGKLWLWMMDKGFVPRDIDEALRVQGILARAIDLERTAFEGQIYLRRQDGVACVGQGFHTGKPVTALTRKQIKNLATKKHATEAGKEVFRKAYRVQTH